MNNNNNDDDMDDTAILPVDPDEPPSPWNVQTLQMLLVDSKFNQSISTQKQLKRDLTHPCIQFPIAWKKRDELKCRLRDAFLAANPDIKNSEMGLSAWAALWKFIRFIIKNCDNDELELLAWKNIME